jgi:hypothetical protein
LIRGVHHNDFSKLISLLQCPWVSYKDSLQRFLGFAGAVSNVVTLCGLLVSEV